MDIRFNDTSYALVKKYCDFTELSFIKYDDVNYTISFTPGNELNFKIAVMETSTVYGLDSDGKITSLGRKLEAIYDNVLQQINNNKAPA